MHKWGDILLFFGLKAYRAVVNFERDKLYTVPISKIDQEKLIAKIWIFHKQ